MTTVAEIFETMEYGPAPEADAPVRKWLADHDGKFGHYIDGRWTDVDDARLFGVQEPANGKALARVAQGDERDVDAAVQAARRALKEWKALGGHARARYLYALARAVQKH